MITSDELGRLADLHQRGALTDDEFARAKSRVLDGSGCQPIPASELRRSRHDRWLGGVCGGLANYTRVPAWMWRLGFATSVMFACTGLVVYLLMWMLVPEDPV